MTTVGYGEGDVANKVNKVVHVAKLLTGGGETLKSLRWSVRGGCIDQGTEKAICDAPNVTQVANVQATLEAWASDTLKLLASEPESFLFPLMLYVSGPLHIIWNGFERVVKATAQWKELFFPFLSSILALLGNHGFRQRFLQLCMANASPEEKDMFGNWRFKTVDWKWEYMEDTLRKVSVTIMVFWVFLLIK